MDVGDFEMSKSNERLLVAKIGLTYALDSISDSEVGWYGEPNPWGGGVIGPSEDGKDDDDEVGEELSSKWTCLLSPGIVV